MASFNKRASPPARCRPSLKHREVCPALIRGFLGRFDFRVEFSPFGATSAQTVELRYYRAEYFRAEYTQNAMKFADVRFLIAPNLCQKQNIYLIIFTFISSPSPWNEGLPNKINMLERWPFSHQEGIGPIKALVRRRGERNQWPPAPGWSFQSRIGSRHS